MKAILKYGLISVTAVLVATAVQGENTRSLSLSDCMDIAFKESTSAAFARADRAIADAQIVQARSTGLPKVVLNADYTRLDELQEIELGGEEGAMMELGILDNYDVSATASQIIYSGGKVMAAIRAAKVTEEHADASKVDSDARLARKVTVVFNNVLLAHEIVKVYAESIAQLESMLKQSSEKYNQGAASEFDVLTAKVRVANEEPVLLAAKHSLEIAREHLRMVANLGDEDFNVEGELQYHPVNSDAQNLQVKALKTRPLIHVAQAMVRLNEENLVVVRSQNKPSLSSFFSYAGDNAYGFALDEEWEWHWTAGLSLRWNAFDGMLTQGKVSEKSLVLEKSRIALEELKMSVKLEVKQAHLKMRHARLSVEAGRENIELAERALEIAAARYKAGMSTYIEFTDANVAKSRARLFYLRALQDHMNARADLVYAIGNPGGLF